MSTENSIKGGPRGRFYGKLPPEMLADLDSLLIKLRRINRKVLKQKTVKRSEIRPLPDDEYLRLWGYLRHCCSLVTTWPNIRKAIAAIAEKSDRTEDDVRNECVDSLTTHVYTYAWRKYRHSEDCGLVFTTAEFGYKAWITSQNLFHDGVELSKNIFYADNPSCGNKVSSSAKTTDAPFYS